MRHITIPPPWQVHAKIAKSHLTRSTSDPLWQQAPVDADDDLQILGIGDARVIIDTWIDYMTHRFVHRYMN